MTGARCLRLLGLSGLLLALGACGSANPGSGSAQSGASSGAAVVQIKTLVIGGIPDQNVANLDRQFELMAKYLSDSTGLKVRYAPAADYAAIVAAFKRGDVQLVWFGGLTSVQAIAAVPGSQAIVHRPRDTEFHSKFIVQADLPVKELKDLKGLTFTFGSESSTSGHLMPRYFMKQAGVDTGKDLKGQPNFSGSHDKTYKLVEAGAFQAGALNEAVWESAVADGKVDTTKVRVFYTTPPFVDYNWTIHADVDKMIGPGTKDKVTRALLALKPEMSPDVAEMLKLAATDGYVPDQNSNYEALKQVGKELGLLP